MNIKLPLIINESGDVTLYNSVFDAEQNLEPIDVHEGRYKGYDGAGRLLRIECFGNNVKIELAESSPSQIHELYQLLKHMVEFFGKSCDGIEPDDIDSLIDMLAELRFDPPKSHFSILKAFILDVVKAIFARDRQA